MLTILKIILFSGLCTITSGMTFDWREYNTIEGDGNSTVDHSNLTLCSFSVHSRTIHYLCGAIDIKRPQDNADKVFASIRCKDAKYGDSQPFKPVPGIPDRTYGACEFVIEFVRKYLLPITRHHNDFPTRNEHWCPIQPRKYNILEVNDTNQLIAPSELPPGECILNVTSSGPKSNSGGYTGRFVAFES